MIRSRRLVPIAVAIALALAACGGGSGGGGEGAPAEEGGTLTFANWQWLEPNRGDAIWESVTGYEEVNPEVTLKKQDIVRKDFENTLKTQMGAGGGPDLLVIPDSFFPELAEAGLLEPLDGALDEEQVGALNSTNEAGLWDGEQLAYSWEVVNYALFWNQAILDQAGVQPPTTPEELVTAAQTITEKTGVPGFAVRHQMNEETVWWTDFANWPYGFGGEWSDGEQLTIDSPENIEAVEAYKAVYDSGAFAIGDDASTFRSKFAQGEIAMMIDNSSALATMVTDNPTVPSTGVGSSALPFPTDKSAHVGVYVGINANSENKELAKDWLNWYFTEEAQTTAASALGASAIGTDVEPAEAFVAANPWVPVFKDQAANSQSAVIVGFETQTPQIRTIILRQLARVLTEDLSPAEALAAAQAEAEQL